MSRGTKIKQDSTDSGQCINNLTINPLNAKLNPICHLLALLEAPHILQVSRIRVKEIYWFCDLK
jgi:hypothetical protein